MYKFFTTFSSRIITDDVLTVIENDEVRTEIANDIEHLRCAGGTCLGKGLQRGLEVDQDTYKL